MRNGITSLVKSEPRSPHFTLAKWFVIAQVALIAAHASGAIFYVNLNNQSPAAPYTTWATSATNIQDAVDVAQAGDTVLVTNGAYATGGRVVYGAMTNRVAVTNAVLVESVNGPAVTLIVGGFPPWLNGGNGPVRCVYLTDGATLAGFTLTNGSTLASGDYTREMSGGGVWCSSLSAVVNNCVLSSNWAGFDGGGAYYGTLNNCIVCGNQGNRGGGVAFATLNNCTVSGNWSNSFKASPPGAYSCTLTNCIVYHNAGANYSYCTFNYSCTTPLPDTGTGNITSDPAFVDLAAINFRLQSNSPCIDTGNNSFLVSTMDLDARPRVARGTVDMGAYEFQPGTSGSFIGWLQANGLPTDGSADFTDVDGDGMNNWQEWRSGTDPANPLSVLKMLVPTEPTGPPNVTLTWRSVNGVVYYLERSTNLAARPAFSGLQSNLIGEAVTTSYIDTTVSASGPVFYRVGVQ